MEPLELIVAGGFALVNLLGVLGLKEVRGMKKEFHTFAVKTEHRITALEEWRHVQQTYSEAYRARQLQAGRSVAEE